MTTLIPASSACYNLQLPPTEKDERLNLNVRTGSASTLYNSLVLTFGGLTIGLEIYNWTIEEIQNTFYDKVSTSTSKYKTIEKYLSGELFYLSLIERTWTRVDFNNNKDILRPKPRLSHQICCINNCLYLFGGLILNGNDLSESLIPINDLWQFNLETKVWTLLHDGNGYENDPTIPSPRYNHKMTPITSLSFVNRKDHFGIFIAGGKDSNSKSIYDNLMFDLVEKKYVGSQPIYLKTSSGSEIKDEHLGLDYVISNADHHLNVDFLDGMILSFSEEIEHHSSSPQAQPPPTPNSNSNSITNRKESKPSGKLNEVNITSIPEESIIVYAPSKDQSGKNSLHNPLLSFKLGKHIKSARPLPVHKKKILKHDKSKERSPLLQTVPFNLKYPTGGLFGQNIVITGFLPGDFDISIFIYNKPTGKWSRLNVFCNHDYGSHRFWGGFAWQSHHKVVLLGNYLTSRTTSSIRFFTVMITVSLPITNILASSELASEHHQVGKRFLRRISRNSFSSGKTGDEIPTDEGTSSSSSIEDISEDEFDEDDDDNDNDNDNYDELSDIETSNNGINGSKGRRISNLSQSSGATSPTTISFSEYVHYAAPKINFTNIRAVFPPAAITLGRNAFDRYGDLISDFELVSCTGDRIPVTLIVLMERWGSYFIKLLARGYIQAVAKFEADQASGIFNEDKGRLRTSKSTGGASTSSSTGDSPTKLKLSESTNSPLNDSASGDSNSSRDESSKDKLYLSIPVPPTSTTKDAPQFRIPFQDSPTSSSINLEKNEQIQIQIQNQNQNDDNGPPLAPSTEETSLPLNDDHEGNELEDDNSDRPPLLASFSAVDPHSVSTRKSSVSSYSSSNSLLASQLQDIPPQLPLPVDQIPAIPSNTSFRVSSRKNSQDYNSPRASLIHTLTALRNIPLSKSPKDSPYASPRASLSAQGGSGTMIGSGDLNASTIPNLRPSISKPKLGDPAIISGDRDRDRDQGPHKNPSISTIHSDQFSGISSGKDSYEDEYSESNISEHDENIQSGIFDNALLNFDNLDSDKFKMEPSLIPRKLYVPFSTITIKAFCEYLYTGQVGNKWLLSPTALDNLAIAKFFKVPLLYDLISEVLFGIIGRKEAYIIRQGNKLKRKFFKLLDMTNTTLDPEFKFPLDEYEGFMDTVDDGYLDIALLKKTSNINKASVISLGGPKRKKSVATISRRASLNDVITENEGEEEVEVEESPKSKEIVESISKEETDSTDESSDRKFASEEDEFELGFLNAPEIPTSGVGPRSKSVFDRSHAIYNEFPQGSGSGSGVNDGDDEKDKAARLTLEQLVLPDSEVPSDYVIDLIYESAAIVTDLKLMLRAANVRLMNKNLQECKIDIEERIEKLKEKYENQNNNQSHIIPTSSPRPISQRSISIPPEDGLSQISSLSGSRNSGPLIEALTAISPSHSGIDLKPSGSQSSLNTIGSLRNNPSLEKIKSNTSFRGISGLTPFKTQKSDKDFEKRFNKVRAKTEVYPSHNKEAKKRGKLFSSSTTKLSEHHHSSPTPSIASTSSKKHHGLFHLTSSKKKDADDSSLESTKLSTTQSSASINSDGTNGKKKHGLFKFKR
ncbi:uncharacterized protein RJT21DRAFT_17560 [Scheffersomyces amazonensis]|uniref:uncharacterized protein n=1 Tax=Scheffersomyces amazonensis TaxID=1078765 RepID=UPI00315D7AEF